MADSEDEREGGKMLFAVIDIALALQSQMKFAQFFAILQTEVFFIAFSNQESRLRIDSNNF